MYLSQPTCGNFTPLQVPLYPPVPPVSTPLPCPVVIGEGDVTSAMYPDGSVQFYFLPTNQLWQPNVFNQNQPTTFFQPNYYNNNAIAWVIRSTPNSFPLRTAINQQQLCCNPQTQLNCDQTFNSNPALIKFHYDGWTSTTDLQYFFPNKIQRDFIVKVNTAVQGDLPEIRCLCSKNEMNKPVTCKHTRKYEEEFDCCSVRSDSSTKSKSKKKSKKKQKSSMKKQLSDKCTTTYNDQAIDCCSECKTQTGSNLSNPFMKCKDDIRLNKPRLNLKKRASKDTLCTCDSNSSFTSTDVPYNCGCDSCDSIMKE